MKRIFIVWGRELEHSRYLAEALDCQLKQIYIKKIGKVNLPVWARYIWQGGQTIFALIKERPSFVVVQNPPVFLPLIVAGYSFLFGAKFIVDTHTVFFLDRKWIFFHGLFRVVAKRAILNTCHNDKNLEILKRWNVKSMVVGPHMPKYDLNKLAEELASKYLSEAIKKSSLSIMMVNRFANDDEWVLVIETARIMPGATFFITGDIPTGLKKIKKEAPQNVFFTGYLNHDEFMKLMWRCGVVLSLTKRKDTVLWSIGEALSMAKTFITSDTEALRKYCGEVGIFTKAMPEDLKNNIKKAVSESEVRKDMLKKFFDNYRKDWQTKIQEIKNLIK